MSWSKKEFRKTGTLIAFTSTLQCMVHWNCALISNPALFIHVPTVCSGVPNLIQFMKGVCLIRWTRTRRDHAATCPLGCADSVTTHTDISQICMNTQPFVSQTQSSPITTSLSPFPGRRLLCDLPILGIDTNNDPSPGMWMSHDAQWVSTRADVTGVRLRLLTAHR